MTQHVQTAQQDTAQQAAAVQDANAWVNASLSTMHNCQAQLTSKSRPCSPADGMHNWQEQLLRTNSENLRHQQLRSPSNVETLNELTAQTVRPGLFPTCADTCFALSMKVDTCSSRTLLWSLPATNQTYTHTMSEDLLGLLQVQHSTTQLARNVSCLQHVGKHMRLPWQATAEDACWADLTHHHP
jgi:hypothetical protein